MYTNIDADVAVTAITATLTRLGHVGEIPVITNLFRLVNEKLPMIYDEQCYLQRRGLAMGANHSPDVANLYCVEEERNWTTKYGTFLHMFRRYIDDCFCIVTARSPAHCRWLLSLLEYPNLKINWEVSAHSQVFLNMEISLIESE